MDEEEINWLRLVTQAFSQSVKRTENANMGPGFWERMLHEAESVIFGDKGGPTFH